MCSYNTIVAYTKSGSSKILCYHPKKGHCVNRSSHADSVVKTDTSARLLSIFLPCVHQRAWSPSLSVIHSSSQTRPPAHLICSGSTRLENCAVRKLGQTVKSKFSGGWVDQFHCSAVLLCVELVSWPQSSWRTERQTLFQRIWWPAPLHPPIRDRKRKRRECSSDVLTKRLGAGGGGVWVIPQTWGAIRGLHLRLQ